MSSTKKYHSIDRRSKSKHDLKTDNKSHRHEERLKDRQTSKYDDTKRRDNKPEDLRQKIKRIKQEQGEFDKNVKQRPRVQLDHLNNDTESNDFLRGANLLRRQSNTKRDSAVADKSQITIKNENPRPLAEGNEKANVEVNKSMLPLPDDKTEIVYSESSDSEDTSSNDEEYEALACLLKRYSQKKRKKKKQRNSSSDEESTVKRKKKKTKIHHNSTEEEVPKEETKASTKRHLKDAKERKKKKKIKKYDSESVTQDGDSQSEQEKKSKKSKRKKKKKKKMKKKRKQTSSDSSSDDDTADLEEDLFKIKKIKEMKMKQLLEDKGDDDREMQNYNKKPHIKSIRVSSDSEPYLDSEAEAALLKAKKEVDHKNEKTNYENNMKKDDPPMKKMDIKESVSHKEKDREKNSDTHKRQVRYCKDDDEINTKRKSLSVMDKETVLRNKIMNNMKNKTSETRKKSSSLESKSSEMKKSNQYRNDPMEGRPGKVDESSHRRSSISTTDEQPSCSSSNKFTLEKTQKKSDHDDYGYERKRDNNYRRDQSDESSRASSERSSKRSSSGRGSREQQPTCSTSYSEKLDQLINEKTYQIYENKRRRDNASCCSFCGISNHTIDDCTENELHGKNQLDVLGRKIDCSQCGSFNHFVDVCIHTEVKGSNPFGFDGKKFKCGHCGSFDHKTNNCGKIHCEKLGKNPMGISGRKIACDNCNSFDHFGHDCIGLAIGKLGRKYEASCEHCGSFSHGSENCKEETKVVRYKREDISIDTYFPFPKSTPTKALQSLEETSDGFCQLSVEISLGPCNWCNSNIHCCKTCPVKHDREYGKNRKNEFGVMLDCEQCGSFNHLVDVCFHSVAKGKNPVDHNGKKLACIFCGSHNHTYPCRDKDLEKHGKNQMDADGRKYRCEYCGSYDHLEKSCYHTKRFGKNLNLPNGTKKKCPFCGSYDHETERVCSYLNDQTREFLRKKIGFDKMKPSTEQGLHTNRFSNILTRGVSWPGNKDPIVVDLDGEATGTQRKSRWNNYKGVSAGVNSFSCAISQEEKDEQIDAEKKMKERLMAKFKMIDPNFFGSESVSKKEQCSEQIPISQQIEGTEEIHNEEIMDEMVYDEPDESIFHDVELRVKTDWFPRITTNMHNDIVNIMKSEEDKITSAHNINITKHDLYGLTGQNWLNDKVIEYYLQMVAARSQSQEYRDLKMPRIHCMSTYFFLNLIMRGYDALERWTKDVDIFSYDILLVPIHMDMHWCIAIIDFRSPGVFYYDSMGGHNMPALSAILSYLREEHMNKKGTELDLRHFAKEIVSDCPQQQNGSDCGIFACKVAEYLSRETSLNFGQEDMAYYRKRMVWEIMKNQLLSP